MTVLRAKYIDRRSIDAHKSSLKELSTTPPLSKSQFEQIQRRRTENRRLIEEAREKRLLLDL